MSSDAATYFASPQSVERARDKSFRWVLGLVTGVHVAAFVYYFQATAIRQPFSDMLVYIVNFLDYRRDGGLLAYLWMPHTQHRLVWTRLVTALDISVFDGVAYPFMVFAVASLIFIPFLMRRQFLNADLAPGLRYAAGILIILFTFTTSNVVDCSIPIEDIYPHTLVFATLSFVLFVTAGDNGRWASAQRAGALLAGCAAGLASAVGLAVWPILFWYTWRMRKQMDARWIAATLLVGCVFTALYLHGMPLPASAEDALDGGAASFYTLAHLKKMALYFLTYMGLPETRHPALVVPGRIAGALWTIGAVGCLITFELLRPVGTRLQRLGCSLILFSLMTAVLATVGRVDEMADVAVPVRYNLYLLPLRIGLLCLALPWLNRAWLTADRRVGVQSAMLVFAFLWTARQFPIGEAAVAASHDITDTIERFKAGTREPGMHQLIGRDLTAAQQVMDRMKQEEIYLFGDNDDNAAPVP